MVPTPTSLATAIVPPCNSASFLAMVRPRPLPPNRRVVEAIGLAELVEDVGQGVGRDADAGVGDGELDPGVGGAGGDGDAAALGELDGVAGQIEQDLVEALGVGGDRRHTRRDLDVQGQPLGGRLRQQDGPHLLDRAGDVDRPNFQLKPAGLDLGQVQYVVDKGGQAAAVV